MNSLYIFGVHKIDSDTLVWVLYRMRIILQQICGFYGDNDEFY